MGHVDSIRADLVGRAKSDFHGKPINVHRREDVISIRFDSKTTISVRSRTLDDRKRAILVRLRNILSRMAIVVGDFVLSRKAQYRIDDDSRELRSHSIGRCCVAPVRAIYDASSSSIELSPIRSLSLEPLQLAPFISINVCSFS